MSAVKETFGTLSPSSLLALTRHLEDDMRAELHAKFTELAQPAIRDAVDKAVASFKTRIESFRDEFNMRDLLTIKIDIKEGT